MHPRFGQVSPCATQNVYIRVAALAALFAAALPIGCGDTGSGLAGSGGFVSTGGTVALGGSVTTGGTVATGGTLATGGTITSSGGAATSGGTSGGSVSVGGTNAGSMNPSSGGAGAGGPSGGAAGGAATAGGAGGKSGSSGGASVSGGAAGTGGASTGSGGKACNSTSDWAPQASDLWIAPTGNDSNPGTEASPKKNLTAAITAWSAGKTIWVMPGTYSYTAHVAISASGTAASMLRISGVTGGAKPVIDFASEPRATNNDGERGLQISGSYVHLRYLELKKAADNCIYLTGSNSVMEWLTIHECQDTGLQVSSGAANNKILNVDSYLNADPTGENADGFAPKISIGQGNYFCGTRSYQNADDGYDCWDAGNSSPVTFEYCWAFGQPGPTATASSDGNGFKLGSPSDRVSGGNAAHKLINCFAFHNKATGFTANGNTSGQITCTDCGAWGNGTAWSAGTGGKLPQHTGDITNLSVTIDKAMNAPRDANGNLPDITRL